MRKLLIAIIFGVLSSLPALANWTGKDATPATITFYNPAVCTSVVCVPVFQITDGTNQVTLTTAGADGVSNTLTGVPAYSRNLLWNGTTWDRQQGIGGAASVTVASSAVAPGAYQAGALVDGADVTKGAKTDTPATLPASATAASEIALLKAIANAAGTPLNNSSIPISISTATTTQLVALSGSTAIYVTSYDVIAGGTGNITFEYGTGTACATGTTVLTGAYPLTAQAGIAKGDGIGTVLKVPAGNALCVLTSAGVQMSGSVSFQQF